ncbi:cation:proton antiporter [Herbaspirillum huttiense]|jgi:Kef-type K+ transport system membrane component KefB|uniref:Cation:proton antiporter n=7 Tax=Pseudomonadota TaxID=1224 RepID=A0AAJ2HC22_9BURK|nr:MULTISPECIES: cation:proton antiporter [Herbaspirillum]MBW9333841.1 cation:proton antiporter [Herbaspirillum sp. RU 5E]MAF02575.1 cation:proton antiporter [Herbaspirillum sp.]MBN9358637.1 cation:proton antiporter [Herbaspirillum huttiense]MBO17091.1 cation:proton antiporter [Herbaspirillum sp.]MBP1315168.1 Kef-type K+ transport system membrane component KefB [Herbaspirillum sp. 1130]|tara:strand:+ start:5481 stop:6689 length:1209 start_codon:yes stop_codon:yes gene_type:complete
MEWALPSFTLAQTLQWNALLVFGGLLLFGLIAGYVVSKSPWVPRITGYLLVGFLLGAGGFNLLSGEVLKVTNIFADIAVALVVYQLGRYVDIGWLRREKWLMITVAVSAVLCFGFVSIALTWFGTDSVMALLGGVMAIATAPAVVLVVLRDLKAEGQVTRRLAAMTALNNFVAVLAAYALLPVIAHEAGTPVWTLIQHTLYSLVGSAILAYLTYWLMMPLARLLGRENSSQFVLVISVIALAIGVAHALHLPVMLTMLIFAILSKNLDRQFDLMELEFGVANELFVVMLFVTVGASMKLSDLSLLGFSVLILIAARFLAMGLGVFLFARFARMNWRQAGLLTLGTLPMTEVGVGLMQTVSSLYPHTTANVLPLLAGSMVVLEFLGPVATQFALIKSGESGRE